MKSAIHKPTGEGAIIRERRPRDPKTVLAQFNRFDHQHSHGWHHYPRKDFRVKESKPMRPMTIMIQHEVPLRTRAEIDHLYVGIALRHPDGRLVYITDGQYISNGRLSNFWGWREIREDGTLGPRESGYGW